MIDWKMTCGVGAALVLTSVAVVSGCAGDGGGSGGGEVSGAGDVGVGPSPQMTCQGEPESCAPRVPGSLECPSVDLVPLGCSQSAECSGVATSCLLLDHVSCTFQEGCFWSSASNFCTGIESSCGSFISQFSCTEQDGCSWKEQCAGNFPTPCDLLSESDCPSQPGCSWR